MILWSFHGPTYCDDVVSGDLPLLRERRSFIPSTRDLEIKAALVCTKASVPLQSPTHCADGFRLAVATALTARNTVPTAYCADVFLRCGEIAEAPLCVARSTNLSCLIGKENDVE